MQYIRLIGAAVMFLGSTYIGFSAASRVRSGLKTLRQLRHSLELMRCEISYTQTPAVKLCGILSKSSDGAVRSFYEAFAEQLPECSGNTAVCEALVQKYLPSMPQEVTLAMTQLLSSFGRFGEDEQLQLIDAAYEKICTSIENISAEKQQRCKCYRTLGVCTGLAIAVLVL